MPAAREPRQTARKSTGSHKPRVVLPPPRKAARMSLYATLRKSEASLVRDMRPKRLNPPLPPALGACDHSHVASTWPTRMTVQRPPETDEETVNLNSVGLPANPEKILAQGTGVVINDEGKLMYGRVHSIFEVSASEEIWVRISWWYEVECFKALSVSGHVPKSRTKFLKTETFGPRELVEVLCTRESVPLTCIDDVVEMYTWRESDLYSTVGEAIDKDETSRFARYQYCIREKKFLLTPESHARRICTCRKIYSTDPSKDRVQHYCVNCNRWSDVSCRLGTSRGHLLRSDEDDEQRHKASYTLPSDEILGEEFPQPVSSVSDSDSEYSHSSHSTDPGDEVDIPLSLYRLAQSDIVRGGAWGTYGNINYVLRARRIIQARLRGELRSEDLDHDYKWKEYVFQGDVDAGEDQLLKGDDNQSDKVFKCPTVVCLGLI